MRKFTEAIQNEITFERIDDIGRELNEIESFIDTKLKDLKNVTAELSKYRSKSIKKHDQIDESVFTLQILMKDLETAMGNLDQIQTNLISYKENGRENN